MRADGNALKAHLRCDSIMKGRRNAALLQHHRIVSDNVSKTMIHNQPTTLQQIHSSTHRLQTVTLSTTKRKHAAAQYASSLACRRGRAKSYPQNERPHKCSAAATPSHSEWQCKQSHDSQPTDRVAMLQQQTHPAEQKTGPQEPSTQMPLFHNKKRKRPAATAAKNECWRAAADCSTSTAKN